MRHLLLSAVLLAAAAPIAAQGIAICSGDTYVAYSTWDRDGRVGARIVTFTRPLTEDSRREIVGSAGETVLHCGASGARLTVAAEGAPEQRLSPASARPLMITCDGIAGGAEDRASHTVRHSFSLAASRIRPFPEARDRLSGDDRFYLVSKVDPGDEPGERQLRVELRERVTRRVERELVLLEAGCPPAGSG